MGRMLVIVIVVSALVGATTGFLTGYFAQPVYQAPQARDFWVFVIALPVNETTFGVPHDAFTLDWIIVNRGDTVRIHFGNNEDEPEAHTFTMGAPYAVNMVLNNGQMQNFTFVANTPGLFAYRCTFHQPTMTGYIDVNP